MAAQVSISVLDAKGKTANYFVNVPSATTIANGTALAQAIAVATDALMGGKITNIGLCYRITLPGGLKALAAANSDVEEGARFTFRGANNFPVQMRIPTFLETFILTGTKAVDLEDAAVDTFVDLMTAGDLTTSPCDVREDDIVSIEAARELFVKDRGV